jgi:hypothetical protein
MKTSNEYSPPRVLIFDTGPLWEYILCVAVDQRRLTSLGEERRFVRKPAQFDRLRSFIYRYPTRATTAHVVAEISHRIRNTKQKERERFRLWETVHGVFRDLMIGEKLVLLSEMDRQIVGRLGAIDAGLIQLGQRYTTSRKKMFIEDKHFAAECYKANLDAVVLSNLVETEDLSGYID